MLWDQEINTVAYEDVLSRRSNSGYWEDETDIVFKKNPESLK